MQTIIILFLAYANNIGIKEGKMLWNGYSLFYLIIIIY